jgi:hypothetical protein
MWAKKHHIWPYLLAYLIPFLSWYTVNQGYYWHLIWIVFGNIPLLEFIAGEVCQLFLNFALIFRTKRIRQPRKRKK